MTIIYQLLFIFSSIIFYWFNLHVLSLFMGLLLSYYLFMENSFIKIITFISFIYNIIHIIISFININHLYLLFIY